MPNPPSDNSDWPTGPDVTEGGQAPQARPGSSALRRSVLRFVAVFLGGWLLGTAASIVWAWFAGSYCAFPDRLTGCNDTTIVVSVVLILFVLSNYRSHLHRPRLHHGRLSGGQRRPDSPVAAAPEFGRWSPPPDGSADDAPMTRTQAHAIVVLLAVLAIGLVDLPLFRMVVWQPIASAVGDWQATQEQRATCQSVADATPRPTPAPGTLVVPELPPVVDAADCAALGIVVPTPAPPPTATPWPSCPPGQTYGRLGCYDPNPPPLSFPSPSFPQSKPVLGPITVLNLDPCPALVDPNSGEPEPADWCH